VWRPQGKALTRGWFDNSLHIEVLKVRLRCAQWLYASQRESPSNRQQSKATFILTEVADGSLLSWSQGRLPVLAFFLEEMGQRLLKEPFLFSVFLYARVGELRLRTSSIAHPHLQQEILTRFSDMAFTIEEVKQQLRQESLLFVKRGDYRKPVMGLEQAGRLQQLDPRPARNESTRFRAIKNPLQQASVQLPLLLH
jgi:hypothetical protein